MSEDTNVIATGYEGDKFVYTAENQLENDLSNIVGSFTIRNGQELYILNDSPKRKASSLVNFF